MKTDSINALSRRQDWRKVTQFGFFTLFLLAPALNLFRFDLTETQLWVLGHRWSLGIDDLLLHHISPAEAALSIVLRGFLPLALIVGTFLVIAYRYGRVYCGWLCPHFSIIEVLNDLMHRACGRYSLWDRSVTPKFGGNLIHRGGSLLRLFVLSWLLFGLSLCSLIYCHQLRFGAI